MKKFSVAAVLFGLIALLSANAFAAEATVQQILDGMTQGGASSVNVSDPNSKVAADGYWTLDASGGSSATMIIELAGWVDQNSFGIYDPHNYNNHVQVFDGAASAGDYASIYTHNGNLIVTQTHFNPDGTTTLTTNSSSIAENNFGFYFVNGNGQKFSSDSHLNNDGGYDHMWAFQGNDKDMVELPGSTNYKTWSKNEYILAWEDTAGGGDFDHNDMVLMIESVRPVPEPGTLLLLGAGMAGVAFIRRRRK